ncbi:hypothetical protein [Streptomyces sp. CC210A]|uniref:hypothetical protein n=1 Tax=Streptomyces sp. CC210A TaxID=2898184 RepID=UPI0035A8F00A
MAGEESAPVAEEAAEPEATPRRRTRKAAASADTAAVEDAVAEAAPRRRRTRKAAVAQPSEA